MNTVYKVAGSRWFPTNRDNLVTHEQLAAGVYNVLFDPDIGFYLDRTDSFTPYKKVYGDAQKHCDRIFNTFKDRHGNTGVLLTGEKGSGKSMLAKLLSIRGETEGVPTLLINSPFANDHFFNFMQAITQPCIVTLDEFEKVYDDEHQQRVLTLFDGVYASNKLFVVTANNKYKVDAHMRNRPGRFFYSIDYKGCTPEFIREYCNDVLVNKSHIEGVLTVGAMFSDFNFDLLKALVEEMNRYQEDAFDAVRLLNASPSADNTGTYRGTLSCDGVDITKEFHNDNIRFNPVTGGEYTVQRDVADKDEWEYLHYNQSNLVKADVEEGVYQYRWQEDGHIFEVTWTKQIPEAFNFDKYRSLVV